MSYRPRFSRRSGAAGRAAPGGAGSETTPTGGGVTPRPFLTEDDLRERRRLVGVQDIVDGLMARIGGGRAGAAAALTAAWEDVAGAEFASRSRPASCDSGRLVVLVADGATASKMRFMTTKIMQKVENVVGEGVVDRISFRVTPGLRH